MIVEKRERLFRDDKKVRSSTTVKKYLALLSHLFSIAITEWQWTNSNPLKNIKKPKEPPGRVRFLSEHERSLLLNACKNSYNPYLYPIVILALSTGARNLNG